MSYEDFFKIYKYYIEKIRSCESWRIDVSLYAEKLRKLSDSVDRSWEAKAYLEIKRSL